MANQVGPEDTSFRVVVCGRKGHGKSTVCNALLGANKFPAGTPTHTAAAGTANRNGVHIKVVDTPDISTVEMKKKDKEAEVERWKQFVSPGASCVLLVIRGDVPYTKEDFNAYRQFRRFWGKGSARERLVVVVTCAEGQDVEDVGERMETESPKWFSKVMDDSGGHYVVFKGKSAGDLFDEVMEDLNDDSEEDKKGGKNQKDNSGGKKNGRGRRKGHGRGQGRGGKCQERKGSNGIRAGDVLCCFLRVCCGGSADSDFSPD